MANPYDQFDKAGANPYDQFDPVAKPAESQTSALGSVKHGIMRSALPSAAGFLAGTAAGAAATPFVTPVGGAVAGIGAGMAASAAVEKAQNAFLESHPHLSKFLGLDEEQGAAEQKEHPYASMIGELAPNLVAFRPSTATFGKLLGKEAGAVVGTDAESIAKAADAAKKAKAATSNARLQALFNAGLGGGMETAQEAVSDQPMDPTKIAIATGIGALGQKETRFGKALGQYGTNIGEKIADKGIDATLGGINYINKLKAKGVPTEAPAAEATTAAPGEIKPGTVPTTDQILEAFQEPHVGYTNRNTQLIMNKFGIDFATAKGVLDKAAAEGKIVYQADRKRWNILGPDGEPLRDPATAEKPTPPAADQSGGTDTGGNVGSADVRSDVSAAGNEEAAATGSGGLDSDKGVSGQPPTAEATSPDTLKADQKNTPDASSTPPPPPPSAPTTVVREAADQTDPPKVKQVKESVNPPKVAPETKTAAQLLEAYDNKEKVNLFQLKKAAREMGLDAPHNSKQSLDEVIKLIRDKVSADSNAPIAPVVETTPAVAEVLASDKQKADAVATQVKQEEEKAPEAGQTLPDALKAAGVEKPSETSVEKPAEPLIVPEGPKLGTQEFLLNAVNELLTKVPSYQLDALADIKDRLLKLQPPDTQFVVNYPEYERQLKSIQRELGFYKPRPVTRAEQAPATVVHENSNDKLQGLLTDELPQGSLSRMQSVMEHIASDTLANDNMHPALRAIANFLVGAKSGKQAEKQGLALLKLVKDEKASAEAFARDTEARATKVKAKIAASEERLGRPLTPEETAAIEKEIPATKKSTQYVNGTFADIKMNIEGTAGHDAETIARLKREGKVAEYDPKTMTIHLTKEGMNAKDILHEATHAVTVETIKKYLTDPSSLIFKDTGNKYEGAPDYAFYRERRNQIFNEMVAVKRAAGEVHSEELVRVLATEAAQQAREEANAKFYPDREAKIKAEYLEAVRKAREERNGILTGMEQREILRQVEERNPGVGDIKPTEGATEKERNKARTKQEKGLEQQYEDTSVLKAAQILEQMYNRVNKHALYKTKHKDALGNLYEFISHAMTDDEFQKDLAKIQIHPNDALYTSNYGKITSTLQAEGKGKKATQTIWNRFTQAVRDLIGIPRQHQVGNVMLEVSEAFNDLVRAPTKVEGVEPLAARRAAGKVYKAPPVQIDTAQKLIDSKLESFNNHIEETKKDKLTRYQKFEKAVTTLQSSRRAAKALQDSARMAGIDLSLYDAISLSTGVSQDQSAHYIDRYNENVSRHIEKVAKEKNMSFKEAANLMDCYMMAMHEPERRFVHFLLSSPLDNTVTNKFKLKLPDASGNMFDHEATAAGHREKIRALLDDSANLTEKKHVFRPGEEPTSVAQELRRQLEDLVFKRDATGSLVKDSNGNYVTSGYVTKDGASRLKVAGKPTETDINHPTYNVTGEHSKAALDQIRAMRDQDLQNPKLAEHIKGIESNIRTVQDNTRMLNRKAGYWSNPVDNHVDFYNFANYITFKGLGGDPKSGGNRFRDDFERSGKRYGTSYTDTAREFGGRTKGNTNNSIFETMADGVKSAMNVGRKSIIDSVKELHESFPSLVSKGESIEFGNREKMADAIEKAQKEGNAFFHHDEDGKITIYNIKDKKLNEAVRRSYEDTSNIVSKGLDALGWATRAVSMSHTRWNPAFAPYNFIRHALTNTFAITADMGAVQGAKFLGRVTSKIADFGVLKAFDVARAYENGEFDRLKNSTDPFERDIYEYIQRGGRSSYLTGLSSRAQYDEVIRELKSTNGVAKTAKVISKFADHFGDMFELTTRAAAYSVAKENMVRQVIDEFVNKNKRVPTEAELAAPEFQKKVQDRAAAYTKELINYEHSGTYGKSLGNLFAFWRANATGAVRAIDSILPAFISVDNFVRNLPEELQTAKQIEKGINAFKAANKGKEPTTADLTKIESAPNVVKAREAQQRMVAKFKERQNTTRLMVATLIGAGMAAYSMSYAAADKDEQGRNKVATDDKSMWVRNWRIPVPKGLLGKDNDYVQIPWGFGGGALAGIGAQMAALLAGHTDAKSVAGNVMTLVRDSYLPLPTAEFNPADDPAAWITDSILPSVLRPIAEYKMNVDTFGRQVHNNHMTKYGSVYEGGDYIPQMYQKASRMLFESTGVKIEPASMHFLASNYVDGYVRMGQSATDMAMYAMGAKDLDPKTVLLPFGNFIGKTTDFDARRYAEVEKDLKSQQETVNMLMTRPDQLRSYMADHPNAMLLTHTYDKINNGPLKKIRQEIQRLQSSDKTPKENADEVARLKDMRDMVMRRMLEIYDEHQD